MVYLRPEPPKPANAKVLAFLDRFVVADDDSGKLAAETHT